MVLPLDSLLATRRAACTQALAAYHAAPSARHAFVRQQLVGWRLAELNAALLAAGQAPESAPAPLSLDGLLRARYPLSQAA